MKLIKHPKLKSKIVELIKMKGLIKLVELNKMENLVELTGIDKSAELLRLEELVKLVRLKKLEGKKTNLLLLIELKSKKLK